MSVGKIIDFFFFLKMSNFGIIYSIYKLSNFNNPYVNDLINMLLKMAEKVKHHEIKYYYILFDIFFFFFIPEPYKSKVDRILTKMVSILRYDGEIFDYALSEIKRLADDPNNKKVIKKQKSINSFHNVLPDKLHIIGNQKYEINESDNVDGDIQVCRRNLPTSGSIIILKTGKKFNDSHYNLKSFLTKKFLNSNKRLFPSIFKFNEKFLTSFMSMNKNFKNLVCIPKGSTVIRKNLEDRDIFIPEYSDYSDIDNEIHVNGDHEMAKKYSRELYEYLNLNKNKLFKKIYNKIHSLKEVTINGKKYHVSPIENYGFYSEDGKFLR